MSERWENETFTLQKKWMACQDIVINENLTGDETLNKIIDRLEETIGACLIITKGFYEDERQRLDIQLKDIRNLL